MKKIILFICFILAFGFLFSQAKQDNYSRVKIYASTQEHFNSLIQNGVCLENLEIRRGVFIVGEFSSLELQKIQETQIPYEILIENMAEYYVKQNEGYSIEKLNEEMKRSPKTFHGSRTPSHFHLGSMGGYFTLDEIMTELDEMRYEFPHLISAKEASSQQTVEGRNIYWVRISNNPDLGQEKPRVLYTALTHAREPAGMHQMIYQMWDLLENYGVDPEITYLIDNLEVYFIPCVCPDGYEYNRQTDSCGGGMWRKNRKPTEFDFYGIDLNRNWGFKWGYDDTGSSPNVWDETYRGIAPFSEAETQILKNFCENKEITLCLNNHTYSDVLIFPFGYTDEAPPEFPIFKAYAERLTLENRYVYGTCFQVLNYYTNGSSDDWMFGETDTKNPIYAFTPEAGKPEEGFWPPSYRIEDICASHVLMNKYMMRFALPYAEIVDKSAGNFPELVNTFSFEFLSLGLVQNASFTVTFEPISNNIQLVQPASLLFENMNILDVQLGEFEVILDANIINGEEIVFDIGVNNGNFTPKYRITKLYGAMDQLLVDDCETMNNWTSTSWNNTTSKYVSPTRSIADSPNGHYSNNANTTIYSKNSYDLTNAIAAFAEFYAQWDIEKNYDYVQFLVSENNGTTWIPQQGKYTKLGTNYQDYNKPVYDGTQLTWVKETIDLSAYKGKNIKMGFRLRSDVSENADGFYFDDFVLSVLKPKHILIVALPDTISFQDTAICHEFSILDYIITTDSEEVKVRWGGNEYLQITYNEDLHQLKICAEGWTGCENVTFFIENPYDSSEQEVVIQCVKTVSVKEYKHGSFAVYYNSFTKKILINNIEKETAFSLFNMEGKLLYNFNVNNTNYELNVSKLSSGVYFLKTNFGEVQKVVVF